MGERHLSALLCPHLGVPGKAWGWGLGGGPGGRATHPL